MKQLNTKQKVCVRLIVGAIAALSVSYAAAESKTGQEIINDQSNANPTTSTNNSSFTSEVSALGAKLVESTNVVETNALANFLEATSKVNTPALALENKSSINNTQKSTSDTQATSTGVTRTLVDHDGITADVNSNERKSSAIGNSANNASDIHALTIKTQAGIPVSDIGNEQIASDTATINASTKSNMIGIESSSPVSALVANVSGNKQSATTDANRALNNAKITTISVMKDAMATLDNNQNSKAVNEATSQIDILGSKLLNNTNSDLNINNNLVNSSATDNTVSNSLFASAGTSVSTTGSGLTLSNSQESSDHSTKAGSTLENLGILADNISDAITLNVNGNTLETTASNNHASNAATLNAATGMTDSKINLESLQTVSKVNTNATNTINNVLGIKAGNIDGGNAGTVSGNQLSARAVNNSTDNTLASTANNIERLEAISTNTQRFGSNSESTAQNTIDTLGINVRQANNNGNVIGQNSLEALARTNSSNNSIAITSRSGGISDSNLRNTNDQLIAAEGVTTSRNEIGYIGLIAPENIGSNNVVTNNLVAAGSQSNSSNNTVTVSSASSLDGNTLAIGNTQTSAPHNAGKHTSATNIIDGIMIFNRNNIANDTRQNTVQHSTVSSNAVQNQSSNVLDAQGSDLSGNEVSLGNTQTVGNNRVTEATNQVIDRIGIAVVSAADEQNVNNNNLFTDAKGNSANNSMTLSANAGHAEINAPVGLNSLQIGNNSKVTSKNDIERIGIIMRRGNDVTHNILENNVSSSAINNLAVNKQAISGTTNLTVAAPVQLLNTQNTSDGFETKANIRIGEFMANITDSVTGSNTLTLKDNKTSSDARANYAINRTELKAGTVLNAQQASSITNHQSAGIGNVTSELVMTNHGISINTPNIPGKGKYTIADNILSSKASGNYAENTFKAQSGTVLNTGNNGFIIEGTQENNATITATLSTATSISSANRGLNGSDSRILNNRNHVYAAGNNTVNNMTVNAGVDGSIVNTNINNNQTNSGNIVADNSSYHTIRDASGSNGVASATLYGNNSIASAVGNSASLSSVIRNGN